MLGFLVAAVLFVAATLAVLWAGHRAAPDAEPVRSEAQDLDAASLLDVLVGSEGSGWEGGAESVERLGLSDGASGIDLGHLEAMAGGVAADPSNGLVDHDEALVSLGLDPAEAAFHLRATWDGATYSSGGVAYPEYRVALVADWNSLPGVSVPLGTPVAMEAAARAAIDAYMDPNSAAVDRAILAQLDLDFNDNVFLTTAAPAIAVNVPGPDPQLLALLNLPLFEGDVYPDDKQYLTATLPGRLDEYEVLIIGSGVAHNSLTSNAVKGAIDAWVDAGGILMAMGSAEASSNWLQPLFHVSLASDAGLSAPVPGHAALNQPHDLAWEGYGHGSLSWDLGDSADAFDHVLAGNAGDVLAIGLEGAFGAGRVLLTTVDMAAVRQAAGQDEAVHLLTNLLVAWNTQEVASGALELGPPVPTDRTVSTAIRQSVLDVGGAGVPVRLEIWLWET